ncbi:MULTISPECIES: hypothetical protein [unclassified Rathayibacter]|uniref:hypothetical protein n=1 Tax=unclassified Rathayibacter TaxID=2609250 RepID=UPI0011B09A19|nr:MULTISPECIES: hypothetical protein [unclassified Rathayibacter]
MTTGPKVSIGAGVAGLLVLIFELYGQVRNGTETCYAWYGVLFPGVETETLAGASLWPLGLRCTYERLGSGDVLAVINPSWFLTALLIVSLGLIIGGLVYAIRSHTAPARSDA